MQPFQPPTTNAVSWRWVSVFLFLTIFFLPLHFHAATAVSAQLNKECSCIQGSRTQLGQIAPPVTNVAIVSTVAILTDFPERFVSRFATTQHSRAPPVR